MTKQEKLPKKDKKRFKLPVYPKEVQENVGLQFPIIESGICEFAFEKLNEVLTKGCALKNHFTVESGRPCTKGSGASTPVDLVVVIDTSGSMADEATQLSDVAAAAIEAAQKKCPSDLRVCWFGIEETWPGTKFTQSYRNFLQGQITSHKGDCRYSQTPVPDSDIVGTPWDREDGAAAIIDIAKHFDWRSGASRLIFYLGDEALEGGDPQTAEDVTAANSAISYAQQRGVTVFTYFGTPFSTEVTVTRTEYERVALETGGQFFQAPADSLGGFQAILESIICTGVDGGCRQVRIPEIRPCFELNWGDGPDDRIETDDIEVLCITACNPYSNITFKDLTVLISLVTDADKTAVSTLPDGTPSIFIKPTFNLYFGDISPCNPKESDEFSCVSREAVVISRGAREGKYLISLAYCFSVEFTLVDIDEFQIDLVKS